jgi:hypothetical protein
MRPATASLQTDNSLYIIESSQASACPVPTACWFLPRNAVCHAGFSVPVSSLHRLHLDPLPRSPSIKFVCIPSSVETLRGPCFRDWKELETLVFEQNSRVSGFALELFQACASLRSICVPCAVTAISDHCFAYCRALSMVTFQSGGYMTVFEDTAYVNCWSLPSICIPSSVESVGSHCFDGCVHLCFVTFEPGSRLLSLDECVFWMLQSLQSFNRFGFQCQSLQSINRFGFQPEFGR